MGSPTQGLLEPLNPHTCSGAQSTSTETVMTRQCSGSPLAPPWRDGVGSAGVQLADYDLRVKSAVAETIKP